MGGAHLLVGVGIVEPFPSYCFPFSSVVALLLGSGIDLVEVSDPSVVNSNCDSDFYDSSSIVAVVCTF